MQGAGSTAPKQSWVEALDDGSSWIRNCSIWFRDISSSRAGDEVGYQHGH